MNNLLNNVVISKILSSLPILFIIFIITLSVIFLIRVVINVILLILINKYQKIGKKIKNKLKNKKNKFYKKSDEELFRYREEQKIPDDFFPKAHSQIKAEIKAKKQQNSHSFEIIESEQQRITKQQENKPQIVDFVKPVGFWTAMILGQKLTYLIQSAQILNKRNDKGFWASMIEAKERAQGRQHSRGR